MNLSSSKDEVLSEVQKRIKESGFITSISKPDLTDCQ